MNHITKEEIIKLGMISHIKIYDHEIDELAKQIESVLAYAVCLDTLIDNRKKVLLHKNSNIFREDVIRPSLPEKILAQAPSVEEHFFVVPAILKHTT